MGAGIAEPLVWAAMALEGWRPWAIPVLVGLGLYASLLAWKQ